MNTSNEKEANDLKLKQKEETSTNDDNINDDVNKSNNDDNTKQNDDNTKQNDDNTKQNDDNTKQNDDNTKQNDDNTKQNDDNTKQNEEGENSKNDKPTLVLKRKKLITDKVGLIIIGVIVVVFIILMILFSEGFRIKKTMSGFETYYRYQTIKNYDYKKKGDKILANHYIASSYNCCNVKNPTFSYMNSDKILKGILKSGARYIEVKIFNNKFGVKNIQPVINNGFETGEWKLCFNSVDFEDFCKVLDKHAFRINKKMPDGSIDGVPNFKDPLFISLDLKTRNNVSTLNNVAELLIKYFKERFLIPDYKYSNNPNLLNIKMKELKGRVIIFSSGGYQGSYLETIINGSWEQQGNLQRHYWEDLEVLNDEDKKIFISKTKQKLTIITPDPDLDKVGKLRLFKKQNYNTKTAFDLGCHFISVYYQNIDNYIDDYITKFRNSSIIEKPKSLHINYKKETATKEAIQAKQYNYQGYRNKLDDLKDYLENIKD